MRTTLEQTRLLLALLALLAFVLVAQPTRAADGKAVFDKTCALCHGNGLAGAPRFGNAGEWSARIAKGVPSLYESAIRGTAKGMPGRGGNPALSDDDVKAAVDYLVAASGGAKVAAVEKKPVDKPVEKPAEKGAEKKAAPAPVARPAPSAPAAPIVATAAASVATAALPATAAMPGANPNSFNRLMPAASKRNPPPPEDGIHDPANTGTHALQAPLTAFNGMPPLGAGNRVNWVKSLGDGKVAPRWDRDNPDAPPMVMDLNIVREVKGSMPDVVYPHKQHTEWLDCSACHPNIFIPQKGANQISMAAIMLGQKCGVCHGKVAFPVSECRLCHSKNKEPAAAARTAAAKP